jgi:dihydrofolate reductase
VGEPLAQSLAREGLVDEYHLFLCPTALAEGRPLFAEAQPVLRRLDAKTYEGGLVSLRYEATAA